MISKEERQEIDSILEKAAELYGRLFHSIEQVASNPWTALAESHLKSSQAFFYLAVTGFGSDPLGDIEND